jgi:hypothetical protein
MNLLPKYFELLVAAQESVDQVDNYDLDMRDSISMTDWKKLLLRQTNTQIELVEYIGENKNSLILQLNQMSKLVKEISQDIKFKRDWSLKLGQAMVDLTYVDMDRQELKLIYLLAHKHAMRIIVIEAIQDSENAQN